MRVMTSDSLSTFTAGDSADRIGAIVGTPIATYVNAKDSMEQVISLSGLTANGTISAGEVIEVTGRNRLNMATRQPILDQTGNPILWRAIVTTDAVIDGAGAVTIIVAGPAIKEANQQYDTVQTALTAGDVVTLKHSVSTLYQPNMFYHKNAFAIGSVPLPKLSTQDTLMKTKDGLQIRMSRGSSIRGNSQVLRLDLLPAFGSLNPFLAGQAYGI